MMFCPLHRSLLTLCPLCLLSSLATLIVGTIFLPSPGAAQPQLREAASLKEAGNFREAFSLFEAIAKNPASRAEAASEALTSGIDCLQRLNDEGALDGFVESAVTAHPNNGALLVTAAMFYSSANHYGYIVAGTFTRGYARAGGATWANAAARDRVRALQLWLQVIEVAKASGSDPRAEKTIGDLYLRLAGTLAEVPSWQLQAKTDLSSLPDYDTSYDGGYAWGAPPAAPVDDRGNPLFYSLPASFESAKNDGERWRWALARAERGSRDLRDEALRIRADFAQQQFGVRTLQQEFRLFTDRSDSNGTQRDSVYTLHTLDDNETIAKLATGVKRFNLPADYDFIGIYKQLAKEGSKDSQLRALETLAAAFEDRRQLARAAEYWQEAIAAFGPGTQNLRQQRLDQIVGAWGEFEPALSFTAGRKATLDFRFRNATRVSFKAVRVLHEKLLDDLRKYLESNPTQVEYEKVYLENLGYQLVHRDTGRYLGEEVAAWSSDLTPRAGHLDTATRVETPLDKAGAYLVTATVAGGNTTTILVWVDDTAIVKKPWEGQELYFIADAATGAPIPDADVELFGYRTRYDSNRSGRSQSTETAALKKRSDSQGFVRIEPNDIRKDYQWLTTAGNDSGRFAFMGFSSIWMLSRESRQETLLQTKLYGITDRPVYRPEQKVHFKIWLRTASYGAEANQKFARRSIKLVISNPRSETISEETVTLDDWGAYEGVVDLPPGAPLGNYLIAAKDLWPSFSFRVEEYKKPEFEVIIDAPQAPVALGDKFQATVSAKYYFGAPVTSATVKYKVERSDYTAGWYPLGRWDWLYGAGYWWFAPNYEWFPGWLRWGCVAPPPWWIGRGSNPPELVQERVADIGPDGTIKIDIDSSIAKALRDDTDHRYTITAEVTDESRRTIVGSGSVIAARDPYRVYAWLDRGYVKTGEDVTASFQARSADGTPVPGSGKVSLVSVTYDSQGTPSEHAVEEWDVETNVEGETQVTFRAARSGQYRISFRHRDAGGREKEGAQLFSVIGDAPDSAGFRFNEVEIITDKREYSPGDTVQLLVNVDQEDATVLLFIRPGKSADSKVRVLRIPKKSQLVEIPIEHADMPNIFVEALTVHNGRVHKVAREIVVPPEERVMDLEVVPSATRYKPGERATLALALKDRSGRPVTGEVVLTAYDRSLEYISGGSNVPEIREFFWKWRRRFTWSLYTNLGRHTLNVVPPGQIDMGRIGIFGDMLDTGTFAKEEAPLRHRNELAKASFSEGAAGGSRMMVRAQTAPAGAVADAVVAAAPPPTSAESTAETPYIRSHFADTAFWRGDIRIGDSGQTTVEFDLPENLTTWKVRAWALGEGTRVGEHTVEVVTSKDLLVRLQTPRFLVEGDEVTLSSNVHNYLPNPQEIAARLQVNEGPLTLLGALQQEATIGTGAEKRFDWIARAAQAGTATIETTAVGQDERDGMQLEIPVKVHGMLKTESYSGAIAPEDRSAAITVKIPEKRKPEQTSLTVRFSPSLAVAMTEALPYLVGYPYGCTEQTLNRFVPTALVQDTLRRLGIDLTTLKDRRSNLNAQELAPLTGSDPKRPRLADNPVFDAGEVATMAATGVNRLASMQNGDGGWGWFSGAGEISSAHLSSQIVRGLLIARRAGVAVPDSVLNRGLDYLKTVEAAEVQELKNAATKTTPYKEKADSLDAFVHLTLAERNSGSKEMREFLFRDRVDLPVYGKALVGLIAQHVKNREVVDAVLRNIAQYLKIDDENQTAFLELGNSGYWWFWYGDEIEAHAFYLKLLVQADPKGSIAPKLVKYLLNNRKNGSYWRSTRDTSLVLEAFADYLLATDEISSENEIEVLVDGVVQKRVSVTPANLFLIDNTVLLEGATVAAGEHTVELRKDGRGPLYFNAYVTNFTLEEDIVPAGLEIKVKRTFYRLEEDRSATALGRGSRGQALEQRQDKWTRVPLESNAEVKSGDLIEVELEVESKNDYEYLILEDPKAAGLEPVEQQSGYNNNPLGAYVEYRDDRTAFFVKSLPRGKRSLSYRLRAEIPGRFSALPSKAQGMYAPELVGNSAGARVRVVDGK